MVTLEIIESNKIIADFMEIEFKTNEFEVNFNSPLYTKILTANNQFWDEIVDNFDLNPYSFLNFSRSYDWIMPVINKISKLDNFLFPDGMFKNLVSVQLNIDNDSVKITDMYKYSIGGDGLHIEFYEHTLIENIFYSCLEFIKWYNNNKK